MAHPLAKDLDHVLAHTKSLWDGLRGNRVFITGGTGFFGTWLLESFAWANDHLDLRARAVVLSRDPTHFREKAPHLADHSAITFHPGDVTDFKFPAGTFSHVIHAATESSTTLARDNPGRMFATIVDGTKRVLEFARSVGARNFLLTSSGAVYGRQPPELSNIPEDHIGGPDITNPASCYAEAKRAAELLCAIAAKEHGLNATIARCFAFIGPHLSLDAHFAVGNFIRDGLAGGPIQISGDGTPMRSYLYAADLAIWLWTILFRGRSGRAYNVGSPSAVSIAELATVVSAAFTPAPEIRIAQELTPGRLPERYVPDCGRANSELGLMPWLDLPEGIRRTVEWHRAESPLWSPLPRTRGRGLG